MNRSESKLEGMDWLKAELEDTLDEEYELELSEPVLSMELRKIYKKKHPESLNRASYFKALLTLQAELIKLLTSKAERQIQMRFQLGLVVVRDFVEVPLADGRCDQRALPVRDQGLRRRVGGSRSCAPARRRSSFGR